jgi:hypothetical protein
MRYDAVAVVLVLTALMVEVLACQWRRCDRFAIAAVE